MNGIGSSPTANASMDGITTFVARVMDIRKRNRNSTSSSPRQLAKPISAEELSSRFLKGVGISVWQCSGDKGSNWTRFAKSRWPLRRLGVRAVRGHASIEKANGFWDRYEEDIRLSADLGCTSFRFSIEWARIEPEQGLIDMEAVNRYHQMLDCMAAHGLEPNATLWHFVHPTWFEDAGGFTKEENIPAFVEYCKRCFRWFGTRIRLWATFNEPTCYLFL
ncbi:hypothetical protein VaNZ11_013340, partial [Volvox africanus]